VHRDKRSDQTVTVFFLQGAARPTCVNELGAELAKLQTGLTNAFFEQVVLQLKVTGTPFNRNRVNNFDNNAECNNEINAVEKLLIDAKLTADAAEVKKCNVNCGIVRLASECVQEKQRNALRAQQALATGNVVTTADLLDRAHLPLFDRSLNAQQQNTFSAVFDGDARNRQTIDGLVAGQIADAVLEGRKGNYQDYKNLARSVADAADKEVKEVVAAFLKELEKDKRITDALANLNALQNQKDGLLVKQAFDLAAKRKAPVALPVVIHARISNIAAGQAETDLINALKAALGPETVLSASVADAANAGKKQLDVAMGVDQGEIATQEHEFGFVCVKAGVNCQFVADVHKPLFEIAQLLALVTTTTATTTTTTSTTTSTVATTTTATTTVDAACLNKLTKGATDCFASNAECVTDAAADNAAKCTCFQALTKCVSGLTQCTVVPVPSPTLSAADKKATLEQCTKVTGCTEAQCDALSSSSETPSSSSDVVCPSATCDMILQLDDDFLVLGLAAKIGQKTDKTAAVCARLRKNRQCVATSYPTGCPAPTNVSKFKSAIDDACRGENALMYADIDCDLCAPISAAATLRFAASFVLSATLLMIDI
jgi:hypothetical protein